jgi:hypothetical protein
LHSIFCSNPAVNWNSPTSYLIIIAPNALILYRYRRCFSSCFFVDGLHLAGRVVPSTFRCVKGITSVPCMDFIHLNFDEMLPSEGR